MNETRDLVVDIRVRVRVNGDDFAAPRVTDALLALLERHALDSEPNGHVFSVNGDYVQVSYSNDYRTNGVPDLVHVPGWTDNG